VLRESPNNECRRCEKKREPQSQDVQRPFRSFHYSKQAEHLRQRRLRIAMRFLRQQEHQSDPTKQSQRTRLHPFAATFHQAAATVPQSESQASDEFSSALKAFIYIADCRLPIWFKTQDSQRQIANSKNQRSKVKGQKSKTKDRKENRQSAIGNRQ
jgi:hypothetical protein